MRASVKFFQDSLELGFIRHTNAHGCDFCYTRFSKKKKKCFMMLWKVKMPLKKQVNPIGQCPFTCSLTITLSGKSTLMALSCVKVKGLI